VYSGCTLLSSTTHGPPVDHWHTGMSPSNPASTHNVDLRAAILGAEVLCTDLPLINTQPVQSGSVVLPVHCIVVLHQHTSTQCERSLIHPLQPFVDNRRLGGCTKQCSKCLGPCHQAVQHRRNSTVGMCIRQSTYHFYRHSPTAQASCREL
jgi:hypothetical protein